MERERSERFEKHNNLLAGCAAEDDASAMADEPCCKLSAIDSGFGFGGGGGGGRTLGHFHACVVARVNVS
jgi:hypothetical protein